MAVTSGIVQKVTWSGSFACAFVGNSPTSTELLFLVFGNTNTAAELDWKKSMAHLLAISACYQWPVTIGHADTNAMIEWISLDMFDISPVGSAIHDDLYSVTGSGFPVNAVLVFDSPTATVIVTPDYRRPHLLVVALLPSAIPLGLNRVSVRDGAGVTVSDAVPTQVMAVPRATVRVLHSGAPKDAPYALVIIGNRAIRTTAGSFIADPVMTDRNFYQGTLAHCLRNIFTVTEDLWRRQNSDSRLRIVSVFDTTVAVIDANSLVDEVAPNLLAPRRDKFRPFLGGYEVVPDLAIALSGSTTHTRASAWFSTDDAAKASTAFTYDGAAHVHGHFESTPGTAAISTSVDRTGLTVIHECGHAASDFNNGMVDDLYVDTIRTGLSINKKARALATDPVPANFATVDGTTYTADAARDGLGYDAGWRSYHPSLIDAAHPNMMDNYWLAAGGNPQVCRLDQLTYDWFVRRLNAKLNR
jgi:hypothetical protein